MSNVLVHASIKEKLDFYIERGKIPNIVFFGEAYHGKKTLMQYFIQRLYKQDTETIRKYVMYVNCAHGKGIKFIRDEVKFFAKTHMHCDENHLFKSIVFLNADHLTIEAQSALRRCIELYSHSTRFFIVLVDKYKLLQPILSRFCEIYVPPPRDAVSGEILRVQQIDRPVLVNDDKRIAKKRDALDKCLRKWLQGTTGSANAADFASLLYEKGFSGLDVLEWLASAAENVVAVSKKTRLQFLFEKFRAEIRHEETIMAMMLHFLRDADEASIESGELVNLSFM